MSLITLAQSTIVAFALISLAACIPAGPDFAALVWKPGRASCYPGLKEKAYTKVDLSKLTCRTRKPILPGSDFPVDQSAGAFGALSDHSPLWNAPKCRDNPRGNPICDEQTTCGLCVEIKCKGYWASPHDHPNTCNPKNSVVIKILDACPGNHPIGKAKQNNPCNQTDIDHFDLYQPAFEHIAQPRDGIISMEYQTTSCDRVGYYVNGQRSSPPFTALPTKS